ncbi:MAG TPA: hypothetical protein VNJ01_04100 [Bacteriovoracaceae bacterium]|nr:hypothetical protein [Bacteriovoracaceae bacterium]
MFITTLLLTLISTSVFAVSFEVGHGGHSYLLTDEDTLRLKSKRVDLVIEKSACSKMLTDDLMATFRAYLRNKSTKVPSTLNFVIVSTADEKIYVNVSSPEGNALRSFPDSFAKAYLVQRELCTKK